MSEYLDREIALGIQGVAIKSGAAKRLAEEQEIYMDIMKRSMPPGIVASTKLRTEMPSGFKMSDLNQKHMAPRPSPMQVSQQYNSRPQAMLNYLSKEEIFAKLGIDPSKEHEIDWDNVESLGNPSSKIDLADKMFDVLQKEKQKLEMKRRLLEGKLHPDVEEVTSFENNSPIPGYKGKQSVKPPSAPPGAMGYDRVPKHSKSGYAAESGEAPWTHLTEARSNYATGYGIRPNRLPYEDEVDMMHEDPDRYQEVNHWYSSMQKPTEENVEVLKKLNHQRLEQLGQIYQQKQAEESMQGYGYDHSQLESQRANQLPKKTNREINKEKEDYKNKFKQTLILELNHLD